MQSTDKVVMRIYKESQTLVIIYALLIRSYTYRILLLVLNFAHFGFVVVVSEADAIVLGAALVSPTVLYQF